MCWSMQHLGLFTSATLVAFGLQLSKVGKWGPRYYEQTTPQVLKIVDSIASVSNIVCDDRSLALEAWNFDTQFYKLIDLIDS